MESKILTKGDIASAKDIQIKEVRVPEWGGSIFVKVLTGNEKDSFELGAYDKKNPLFGKIRAGLCAKAICDSDGKRLFSDDPAEVESLGDKNSTALDRLFEAARKLNKLTEKEIEELGKTRERPGRRFIYKLALALHKTVGELLGSLNAVDIAEWMVYDRIEPFGEERADLRSAQICCILANVNRGKGQRAFKIDDFMPKFEPKQRRTAAQMAKTMKFAVDATKKIK